MPDWKLLLKENRVILKVYGVKKLFMNIKQIILNLKIFTKVNHLLDNGQQGKYLNI